MAKYIRADIDTPRSWSVAWGIWPLIFAVGFAMTGFLNFWWGIVLMGLAALAMAFDIWRNHNAWSRNNKITCILLIAAGYLILLWFAFVAAPLDVLINIPDGNYPTNQDVLGIKWKASYYPVNIVLGNETDADFNGFDSYVRTNNQIFRVGIRHSINQCVASLENPYMVMANASISHEENGQIVSVPIFQDDQESVSTFYRIRCDKIAAKSRVEIVLASTSGKPLWTAIKSTYSAAGRSRDRFNSQCFTKACPGIPKSFEDK
jgi:hypothetical protein